MPTKSQSCKTLSLPPSFPQASYKTTTRPASMPHQTPLARRIVRNLEKTRNAPPTHRIPRVPSSLRLCLLLVRKNKKRQGLRHRHPFPRTPQCSNAPTGDEHSATTVTSCPHAGDTPPRITTCEYVHTYRYLWVRAHVLTCPKMSFFSALQARRA